ncbi:MAG TPA: glycosyltransferase family 2 protein [Actinomycetota bacterium]|nr:glycosyltransferase family 2 protein [Actinomycetota bacterium]
MTEIELLTVIIPVYNERATLRTSVERLLKIELPLSLEVIVVDDGSNDGSAETIAELEGDRLRLIRHARNRGKGAAIRSGLEQATGDVLAVLDADLEYHPGDYRKLLEVMVVDGARVVYGTRQFGAHTAYSFWYVIGNKVLALWTSFLFNTWLSDVETCFKMAHTSIWRSVRLRSDGFGIEAEMTAKVLKSGERIFEVPISYKARSRAEGKKLRFSDGLLALWIILRVRLFGR